MPEMNARRYGCVAALIASLSTPLGASEGATELWWDTMRGLDLATGIATPQLRALQGQRVRIPGWAVPLDSDAPMTIKEFVLVPGFGMCVHVPPPPANQMVFVKLDEALHFQELLGPLWIEGELSLEPTQSKFGAVSYRMRALAVEPYKQAR